MVDIQRITKNGKPIIPVTTTDAVIHYELQQSLSKVINEYNITSLLPTSGIDNSDKYNLQLAIDTLDRYLSASQKQKGIKIIFDDGNTIQEYLFLGGQFTLKSNWNDSKVDSNLENKIIGDKNSVTNGFDYPFVQLGTFSNYEELKLTLDTLHSTDNTAQVIGEFRARLGKNILFIRNYVKSWEEEDFIQYIEGNIKLDENNSFVTASYISSFYRRYSSNDWNEWLEIDSGGSGGTGDYVEKSIYETEQSDQDKKISELEDAVFPLTISVSGGGLFEKGTTQNITITWTVKKGSNTVIPDTIKVNEEVVTEDFKNYNNVTENSTYTVKATYNTKEISGKTTATFIAPMYFGFSQSSSVSGGLTIDSLNKQSIKTSPNGTYTLNNSTSGHYLWLCVPNSMTINKVTSSGFDVPMLASESGSTSVDTYKCYRSAAAIDAGDITITIS